jgi:hypothetical protein
MPTALEEFIGVYIAIPTAMAEEQFQLSVALSSGLSLTPILRLARASHFTRTRSLTKMGFLPLFATIPKCTAGVALPYSQSR